MITTDHRDFLGRFDNVKQTSANEWSARCPVHDDKKNSLSISTGKNGKLLFYCHSGCSKESILSSIGLSYKDLFADSEELGKAVKEAAYSYYDATGREILRKIRMRSADGSKFFFWLHKDGSTWKKGRAGIIPPLFGTNTLCEGSTILFVVEGEKDAINVKNVFDYDCVSLPDGAKQGEIKWHEDYNQYFSGRSVYIIPDNDSIGAAFAELEAQHIKPFADAVYILDLSQAWPEIPEKGDISDMIAALGEFDAFARLNRLCEDALPWATSSVPVIEEKDSISELRPILKELQRIKPEQNQEYNDQIMGRLYAELFRKELRYNVTAKEWYFFNGRYWQIDTGGMIAAQKAKILTDALLVYSTQTNSKDFIRFAVRYGQLAKRKIMLEDARSECFISNSDFDRNGNYLNCINGTFDLSNFELLPHDPEHLLSKISNVIYDPAARSEDFERFISEIMQGNQNKILYLQKTLGISLTADTSLEKLWFWYGATTRNGKGTLAETIGYMLGNASGYALTMSPETLAQRKVKDTRQASGDIARLNGCRFLNASEPPKRMLFDSALLKLLTGRDTIVARNLMEREFEFTPMFKLFINTNYLPRIQDDTLFQSERINVLTFDRHFTPEEQDEGLKDRLRKPENISGIFNWCLEGLRIFRETGLTAPDEVKNATADYRESSDKIASFIADCMEKTGKNSSAAATYQKYTDWCNEGGYGTESKRSFFEDLQNKGLYAERGMVNGVQIRNIIIGYELIEEPETFLP